MNNYDYRMRIKEQIFIYVKISKLLIIFNILQVNQFVNW